MALKRVIKVEKRLKEHRLEYGETTLSWFRDRKNGWRRYQKRQYARALRSWGRALIEMEQRAEDPWYEVPVAKGSKQSETRRRRQRDFRAWWDIMAIRYRAPFDLVTPDVPLSEYWRRRQESYRRRCRERRTAYWKKFIV